MQINFRSWYWTVGGDTTRAYFSGTNTYVASDDAAFTEWKTAGYVPTPILNEAELWGALRANGVMLADWLFNGTTFVQPSVGAYTQAQLASYAAVARDNRLTSGIIVNGQPFATDAYTYSSLNSAYIFTQAQTGSEFSWKLPDGSFVTLNKADIAALHNASNSFGQQCYACEDTTLTAIEAGTIIDTAAIDAAFAAVSNNFTGMAMSEMKVRHAPKK